jgi:HK97 family phage major capsid protein
MDESLSTLTTAFEDAHKKHAAIVHAWLVGEQQMAAADAYLAGAHPVTARYAKAAVSAMDTSSGLAPTRPLIQALLAGIDRRTVLGQLGAVRVPMAIASGVTPTTAASSYWVGETSAKPLTAMAFAALTLTPKKLITEVVVSEELLNVDNDSLNVVERLLSTSNVSALDDALLDTAASSSSRPAGLLNALTGLTPAGDFQNQVGQVLHAISGGAPSRPTLVVSLQTALRLSALPGLRDYVKVIVSPSASNKLIAIDAAGIAFTDDGARLVVGQPTLQMADNPDNPTTASTVLISTWQKNLYAIRLERFVAWTRRDAVAYLTLA